MSISAWDDHGKISHEAVKWHFAHILDEAQKQLHFTEGWLRKSHDFEGHPHQAWIEATTQKVQHHLDMAQHEIDALPHDAEGNA